MGLGIAFDEHMSQKYFFCLVSSFRFIYIKVQKTVKPKSVSPSSNCSDENILGLILDLLSSNSFPIHQQVLLTLNLKIPNATTSTIFLCHSCPCHHHLPYPGRSNPLTGISAFIQVLLLLTCLYSLPSLLQIELSFIDINLIISSLLKNNNSKNFCDFPLHLDQNLFWPTKLQILSLDCTLRFTWTI